MRRICNLIAALMLVLGLCACGQSAEAKWQEQYDLGVRYLSEGNYEEAIIAFTAAIDIDPKRPAGFVGRGDAYALSGDTEDNLSAAQADYEAAIALDETLPGGWLGLADVYIRQGDYDKALETLREGLDKTGGDQSIADKIEEMESGSFSDSSGNLRRKSYYDENGALTAYFTYTYNSQGRTASVTGFDAGGNQVSHIDCVYDQAGNQLVSAGSYHIDDGRLGLQENEYDANGKVIKETLHVSDTVDSEVDSYTLGTYDGEGNLTRREHFEGTGELSWIRTYEYSEGVVAKETLYNGDGTLRSYYLYEYDSEDRLIGRNYYDEAGTPGAYEVYSYDEEGNRKSIEMYRADGTLDYSTVYN